MSFLVPFVQKLAKWPIIGEKTVVRIVADQKQVVEVMFFPVARAVLKYLKQLKVNYCQQLREIKSAFASTTNSAIMFIGKMTITFPIIRTL